MCINKTYFVLNKNTCYTSLSLHKSHIYPCNFFIPNNLNNINSYNQFQVKIQFF